MTRFEQLEQLLAEHNGIDILAYNLETVLAEKAETIISRATANTRMRDFYDIYILNKLYGNTVDKAVFRQALVATAHKRETEQHLADTQEIFNEVESSPAMQKLWSAYRKKFSYAASLEWADVMTAVRTVEL